jgi:hypothetical protein
MAAFNEIAEPYKGGSHMNNTIRIQEHTLKNQVIYVGLEDSKKSWKLCIRSLGKVVKEASIPADYSNQLTPTRGGGLIGPIGAFFTKP